MKNIHHVINHFYDLGNITVKLSEAPFKFQNL